MTDILEQHFSPSDQTVENRVGEETVLLHLENGTYCGLDLVGTQIWGLLKQGQPALAICDAIAASYGVDREQVRDDACRFMSDSSSHHILLDA